MRVSGVLPRRGAGVTLVELVVVVSLLAVVLAFVLAGVRVAPERVRRREPAAAEPGRGAGPHGRRDQGPPDRGPPLVHVVAVRRHGRQRPPAPGFGNAAPYAGKTEVWFYANLTLTTGNPPCPDVVHLYVDSAVNPPVLKEQIVAATPGRPRPNCTYTGSYSTAARRQVRGEPESSLPVFTYYYDDATGTPVGVRGPPSTPLSAADRLLVNAVGITLAIRQSTNYNVPYTTLDQPGPAPERGLQPAPEPESVR